MNETVYTEWGMSSELGATVLQKLGVGDEFGLYFCIVPFVVLFLTS